MNGCHSNVIIAGCLGTHRTHIGRTNSTRKNRGTSTVDDAPWCVLGHFNAVLHPGDRVGGVEVTEGEITDFADCLLRCRLHEFHHTGVFFTWTNKTIWSRIDMAFYNDFWHDSFDFTHVHYLTQGPSDHSPIALSFPSCPKPKSSFQFCDMWAKDETFEAIILNSMQHQQSHTYLGALS
ncbi:hypothetical protein Cgig2_020494 [Carnegiea gigantea]|uniref:Endonuclease/exonuclease/phosphatase domain-containing protein n=1 Tax=Carnegiea gigantea TaxID=171969 RepID=A0A9Q1QG61_9CARY|nr:hypothetical protein Cgig2_020494 [Carnegiea gigantea]